MNKRKLLAHVVAFAAVVASGLVVQAPAAQAEDSCNFYPTGAFDCAYRDQEGRWTTIKLDYQGYMSGSSPDRNVHLDHRHPSESGWTGPIGGSLHYTPSFTRGDHVWRACSQRPNGLYSCTGWH